jgi:hypothetical protein
VAELEFIFKATGSASQWRIFSIETREYLLTALGRKLYIRPLPVEDEAL